MAVTGLETGEHSMKTNRGTIGRAGPIILAAALGLIGIANAKAFEVTAEQRAACTPDAFRLCSSEIPDVTRIVACMKAKEASLSAPCRAVFQTASRALAPHQRLARRTGPLYASNRIATSPFGHRHLRQAFRELASHGRRIHRLGAAYAIYGAPSSALAGRRMHWSDEREALLIGRKVMLGYAMACQNHSIPDDLCDFSGDSFASLATHRESYQGSGYAPAWGDADSNGGAERESHAKPVNFGQLGSFFGSFSQ
jgi:hypothetical protein